VRLKDFNGLDEAAAVRELLRCCGSTRWAHAMAAARPFASFDALCRAGDQMWRTLAVDDVLEAFRAHPTIGDTRQTWQAGQPDPGNLETAWSDAEQAGVRRASDDVRERLAAGNRAYEARFGYIFIICAAGRSAEEMLAALETRLHHSTAEELPVAAEEQRQIARLRLAKLVDDDKTP
jgi:OHCU decarboxylase